LDKLIEGARFETGAAKYDAFVKELVALCMEEVPVVPLNQPMHDVAMQKSVTGYQFWFHREPDLRQVARA